MAQIWYAVRYARDDLCMPQAAARLLDEIEEAVSGLSSMPNRFHAVEVEPLLSACVRRMNVRGYSIFYRVDETNTTVDVIGVLRHTLGRATQKGVSGRDGE